MSELTSLLAPEISLALQPAEVDPMHSPLPRHVEARQWVLLLYQWVAPSSKDGKDVVVGDDLRLIGFGSDVKLGHSLSAQWPKAVENYALKMREVILGADWETRRANKLVEELILRCSRLILENDRLRSWIDYWNEQVSLVRSTNAELADQIHDAHVLIAQLGADIAALTDELRLAHGVSSRSRQRVRSVGRLSNVLDETLAAIIGGLLVLGVQVVAAPDPPAPEIIVQIANIGPLCTAIEPHLPEGL